MLKLFLRGFTLPELLISLLILGEIATFTIPKVLNAQQNGRNNAIAKENIAAMSGAYQLLQFNGGVSASTTTGDLTPYINYVSIDTTSVIDNNQTRTTMNCSSAYCLKMHNGSIIYYEDGDFCGTNATNAIWFDVDPDGRQTDGTTNGPGKSLTARIYYNGRISTWGTLAPGTIEGCGSVTATPAYDPPWFQW